MSGNIPGESAIFMKVLEEFRVPYVVVYDEDDPNDKTNGEIVARATDPTRLCVHRPNLEKCVGFAGTQKNKVEAALTFLKSGLTAPQRTVLQSPWRRLFAEVRPDLVPRLT